MRLQPITLPGYATDVEFLASKKNLVTKAVTLDASKWTAGTDGRKIVKAGTVLGKITASGLFGPYKDGNADGTETADCILLHTVDLTDGNAAAAAVTQGVVREARLTGIDANGKADLKHIEFR